ncbi:anthranilate phosphoribosyltransferase [Candidatus Gottesmanbacteria bacterium RIFCSPHIGHO2_01_FULL_39_10]|uniref:Anthranilate phosphoribosyltransferase n=1 Tax=Candidatus Gottesmanbacteria bacterium RIFCSPHIGHO2_01_FULL_39_10 TaxID=1798375 RepID=A0A1F5ZLN0_9BACT|nr:MAG: anthranilate phosphoribosyltransferase [Candidatus Gottesmanbacteria bacterium RIFCSPHIGHO2_01_FULL_39_10]
MIKQLLNKLIEKKDLTIEESEKLMEEMLRGNLTNALMASVLTALRMKGESVEEMLGFINVMRKYMQKIKVSGLVIDTCGTGGDGKGTFNISTATALVVAGAGVKVAKHGNRSASSFCGSADVLEELGVNIQMTPRQAEDCLQKVGITFLFAPLFHPAMKHVAGVRKELGIRTVFNFLGPFVNPARVRRQIVGVSDRNIAEKLMEVAKYLDYEHLLIVISDDGLDEISISNKTRIFEIKNNRVRKFTMMPENFGIKRASIETIKGRDAKINAKIIERILEGEKGPKRDVVILNSAAALYVAGKVKDINSGIKLAEESIDRGKAKKILEQLINYGQ